MSKYEKLGTFLLFDKVEEDRVSKNFIAGQVLNNQVQQMHWIKKFDHSFSSMPDFVLDMNQEMEILKGLSNPALFRPADIVKDKAELAAVFDYFEGKSLRSVLQKCSQEGYPFTADHALLIGSRICAALEYLHSKKVKDQRLVHGYVCPETVFITYDGETKLLYLGLASLLLKNPSAKDRFVQTYKNYLAPEVLQSQRLDKAADVYSVGAVLYEMLTGETLFGKGREGNVQQAIDQAQMHNQSGDKIPIPDEIKKALHQALATDPAHRFSSIGDLRKLLDQQLFTSDYSPTTFNLAFFMNSLFRENMDQEGKNIKGYKKIDVATYMKEEPAPAPAKTEHPVGAEAAKDIPVTPLAPKSPTFGGMETVAEPEKEKSKTPLFAGILIAIAVIGAVAYFLFKPSTPAPTQTATALNPQQQKAADAERTKLQEEAKAAADEAKKKDQQLQELQAKLDALMKQKDSKAAANTPDAATIQQLQQQAKQLEEERKKQEALAAEKLKAAAAPPPAAPPEQKPAETKTEQAPVQVAQNTPPPQQQQNQQQQQTPAPQNPAAQNPPAQNQPALQKQDAPQQQPVQDVVKTEAAPATKEGDTVELTPDVVKPELQERVQPAYPPAARTRKVQGTVILSLLVSERGDVADVKVLREAGGSAGLNEAAVAAAKRWKFRPAVKDGKRVKVWVTYPVSFKLEG